MIEINNFSGLTLDEKFLKKIGQTVLKGEGKEKYTFSIALIKEKEIRDLNKKYLKKDKPTDVLSFSLSECTSWVLDESKDSSRPSLSLRESLVGEVIICPQVVKRNAEDFNIPFRKELAKVLIHGILHLLGYEHEKSDKKWKEMQKKENYYLSLCFS